MYMSVFNFLCTEFGTFWPKCDPPKLNKILTKNLNPARAAHFFSKWSVALDRHISFKNALDRHIFFTVALDRHISFHGCT